MNPRGSDRFGHQLTFDLPHRAALGRDDFLVSSANRQAVAMIDRWPDWLNPGLILIGPPGSGKTHLAEVWRSRSGARMCSSTGLAVAEVPALLSQGAVVVENLPGAALDQPALFHLINLARETGGYLLLTSEAHPPSWNLSLNDLASRLKAMPIASLGEPDDDLLRGLLVKLFADRQIAVDEPTIAYMLTHMERSAAFARRIVDTIDRIALAERAEVTRSFVARLLRESAERDAFPEDG
jgi:chromosomal replication initiation ATPase DnaA